MTRVTANSASAADLRLREQALRWSDGMLFTLLVWSVSMSGTVPVQAVSAAVLGLLGSLCLVPHVVRLWTTSCGLAYS